MIQKTKKTPGQVIDLPKPPDHIIVDINPIKGIKCIRNGFMPHIMGHNFITYLCP
jgi:hypothetical protein